MASSFFEKKTASILKFRRSLASYGGSLTRKLISELDTRNMNAKRNLRNSIRTKIEYNSKYVKEGTRITIFMKNYGFFLNKNMHPKSFQGRGQGGLVDGIQEWMEAKGIKPGKDKRGRQMNSRSAAYVIARNILKKGFHNKTFNWITQVVRDEAKRLRKKSRNDIRRLVVEMTREQLGEPSNK